MFKQQKVNKSGDALIDAEAEEEEEEEEEKEEEKLLVLNISDSSSTTQRKTMMTALVMTEDFNNIVDEFSDNDGDDEVRDAGRKSLAVKEETNRHKEITRRIREGYDGRRECIVGGVGWARGCHRFDQPTS